MRFKKRSHATNLVFHLVNSVIFVSNQMFQYSNAKSRSPEHEMKTVYTFVKKQPHPG